MTFREVMDQVTTWLQQDQRISYRALKRQFALADDYLDDLKMEMIEVKRVAVDHDGIMLVWTGAPPVAEPSTHQQAEAERQLHTVLLAVMALLQREQRVTYRTLHYIFGMDEACLHAVRDELHFRRLAREEGGQGLVWTGETLSLTATAPHLTPDSAIALSVGAPYPPLPPSAEPRPLPEPTPALDGVSSLRVDDVGPQTSDDVPIIPAVVARSTPEAERRQLTVLFCDLVGSTQLSGQLDPEDLRMVVRAYQEAAAEVIARYGGHIAQYLGDGLLVYFGYPTAHEDDARRAVHTGLGIVEAMATLNGHLQAQYRVQLAVRLGIHTGPVVVGVMGGGGRHEHLALGETPNIAARLQNLAPANAVVVSAVTAQLVQGAFILEALGTHTLHGVVEPLAVNRVRGLLAAPSHDEECVTATMSVLVGREEERGLLRRRWEQSKAGVGQVVYISGEAGIGKSALVEGLRSQVRAEGLPRIAYRCSPYHTTSALSPVITHIEHLLQWAPDDPPATKLGKLEMGLKPYDLPLAEVVPLVAGLLSVPLPAERYAPLTLTPQQQKQQTLDALLAWLAAEAERQPVLVVWEDLHWADPTTLELLGLVIAQAPTVPMLHVLTARPEFTPPWPQRSHLTPLVLTRLERPQVEALMTQRAGDKSLPAEVVQHIVAKTDGVPLYVEELTKMLLASPLLREEANQYVLTGPLRTVAIPETLQDALMARLDQLQSAKEVAQLGAVLGREFPYELLQAMAPQDEDTLQAGLAQLVGAELLYQRGRPPRARYIFKHALIQDAAYASLLKRTRQHVHQQVAHILETRFPVFVETQPELLAQHYTAAGCPEQAVVYWQRAGHQASARSAYVEALEHLRQGMEMLQALPETGIRAQHELALQLTLGESLEASHGYTAPAVAQAYARVHALCHEVGASPQLCAALVVLRRFYALRGEMQTAQELAEQLLQLAQHQRDAVSMQEAHWALGQTLYFRGELVSARTHLERSMACYAPRPLRSPVARDAAGTQIACQVIAAWNLWRLGYADQALAGGHAALRLAHELAHPFTLVMSLYGVTILHWLRREVQGAHECNELALARAQKQGFPTWIAWGTAFRGWIHTMHGQAEMGMAEVRQALTLEHDPSVMTWPFALVQVEIYHRGGHTGEGLRVLAEALAGVDTTGVRDLEAELYRAQGELLLAQSPEHDAAAETCLTQALALARRQEAKAWELRAAMSLSRLWHRQGKQADAQQLLMGVYAWFTEGLETADLSEARAWLDTLASGR